MDSFAKGPQQFRIHGKIHHYIGALLPMQGHSPKFAQVFILNIDIKIGVRLENNFTKDLDHHPLRGLQDMLRVHNPYVQAFQEGASCVAQM